MYLFFDTYDIVLVFNAEFMVREYWKIYIEDLVFSQVDFTSVEKGVRELGGANSYERQESLVIYKLFNTLC